MKKLRRHLSFIGGTSNGNHRNGPVLHHQNSLTVLSEHPELLAERLRAKTFSTFDSFYDLKLKTAGQPQIQADASVSTNAPILNGRHSNYVTTSSESQDDYGFLSSLHISSKSPAVASSDTHALITRNGAVLSQCCATCQRVISTSAEDYHSTQFAFSLENNSSSVLNGYSTSAHQQYCSCPPSVKDRVITVPVYPSEEPSTKRQSSTYTKNNYFGQVKFRKKPPEKRQDNNAADISKRHSLPVHMISQSASPSSSGSPSNGSTDASNIILQELASRSRKDRRSSLADYGFGKSSSYRKLEKLGQGTYATVYRGKSLLTEALVALKEIRLEHEEGAPCTAIREVSLLRDLKHANIVTLHDIIHTDKSLTLVFEYLDKDLKQCLDECNGLLHECNVRLYMYQLVRGLAYCHQRRYLHRDLKPQNLLINDKGELKLADFGLARAKSVPIKTYSNEVCTLWYRPPDVLLGNTEYSTHIDLWGVGAIFFEMITARPLYPGSTVVEQLQLIFRSLGTPSEQTWPGCTNNAQFTSYNFPQWPREDFRQVAPRLNSHGIDLLLQFLQYEATNRISAYAAKYHSYFMNFLPAILNDLPDTSSIFEVPGISLYANPVVTQVAPHSNGTAAVIADRRRQSMLF